MTRTIAITRRPHQVRPGPAPALLTEGQLAPILAKLIPTWESFKVSKAIHALRLWGPDATFGDPKSASPFHTRVFTGRELLGLFLDHRQYLRSVHATSPILEDSDDGVIVRYKSASRRLEGDLAHVDKLLRVCGELDIPSDFRIRTPGRETTLREVVRGAVANFDASQELEWSVEAFARYFEDAKSWTNRFGETFGFDEAVQALAGRGVGKSPCFGTHLPYALTMLYRLDDSVPRLGRASKETIRALLRGFSDDLERSQRDDGSWPMTWSGGVVLSPEVRRNEDPAVDLTLRLTVLGHHLEWIGFAPEDLRPGLASIRRAVDFALESFHRVPLSIVEDQYHALTHLGKALCTFAGVRHTESDRLLRDTTL